MKLVKIMYGDDDAKKSYDAATALLNGYPQLGGIMAPEPAGTQAAVKAKDDLRFNKNLVISGLGWPPSDSATLTSGKMKSFFLWSPVDLGYLTYYANAALLSGQITGAEGETFKAGRLGEMKVGKNGTVTLGAPQKYTAANVEASLSQFRTS